MAALAAWGGALWAADSSTAAGKTPGANTAAPSSILKTFLACAEAHGWHTAYQIYGDAPRSLELSPDMETKTVVPGGKPRLAVMKKNWALNGKAQQ